MPVNRFSILVISVWMVLPLLLFGLAWRKYHQHGLRTLLLPTLSAVLILLALIGDLKVWLLGPDYSHRLYVTIEANLILAIIATVYFVARKRWVAAVAALILALGWVYMGSVNSVV